MKMGREALCFVFIASLSTSICIKMVNFFFALLARSYGHHDDGIPGSEHASAPI